MGTGMHHRPSSPWSVTVRSQGRMDNTMRLTQQLIPNAVGENVFTINGSNYKRPSVLPTDARETAFQPSINIHTSYPLRNSRLAKKDVDQILFAREIKSSNANNVGTFEARL